MSSNDDTGRTEALAAWKRGIDQRVSAIEEAMATKEDLARGFRVFCIIINS